MRFNELTQEDKDLFRRVYSPEYKKDGKKLSRLEVQQELSDYFNIGMRTVRLWANKLEVGVMSKNITNPSKILVYDIETCRIPAKVFWTGKQYISHNQLMDEPRIISVSWKWLGSDKVEHLVWDKNQNDENLVLEFAKVYNSADMVVGVNNDNFDNRWLNARIAKYGGYVNTFVKSFDVQKQAKRLFRLPSYSMAYLAKFFGCTLKQTHEGILMWDKIEEGTKEEQREYLQKMVDYNIGDIVTTEEIFLKLRKYMGHKVHFGVLNGGERWSCPSCGSTNVELVRVTATPAGTLQYIMRCNEDEVEYKLSATNYNKFLDSKIEDYS